MRNPYDDLPKVPAFTVKSPDITDGDKLSPPQLSGIFGAGGEDVSPELSWSGFPVETKSFAVTLYDPDAPTGSGFWHWIVIDIPGSVTTLPRDAGAEGGSKLPAGASQLKNDAGLSRFLGAAPPAGHGKHRYFFVVHALDVNKLEVANDAMPGYVGFNLSSHALGRALIVSWYEVAARK